MFGSLSPRVRLSALVFTATATRVLVAHMPNAAGGRLATDTVHSTRHRVASMHQGTDVPKVNHLDSPKHLAAHASTLSGLQIQCGVNFFILDSRRVLAPAPTVPGSDIKTHLKSRFCAI